MTVDKKEQAFQKMIDLVTAMREAQGEYWRTWSKESFEKMILLEGQVDEFLKKQWKEKDDGKEG